MPILTIEVVGADEGDLLPGLAQALADATGTVMRSPPGQTWVRLRALAAHRYAEHNVPREPALLPVFVAILERSPPTGADLEARMSAVTDLVAKLVGRPAECVHVEYAPSAAGRLAFGGQLVR